LELRALFINRLGPPRWTIIHGQSMGGHISIATLELYPDVYRGGLIECGNIDGIGLTDWLHAYTAAAEYFSGLPLLDTPRPEFSAPATVTWPERMGEPGYYTERGRRFDTSSSTSPAVTCRSASKGRWSAMSRTLTRAIPGRDVPGNSSVTRIHGTSPTTLTPGWASMPQP
jgi:pimeloyl-ACP methyl ester carboxylesterase